MSDARFIPLPHAAAPPEDEMRHRAGEFYAYMRRRRTVRDYSDASVPLDVIETCLRAAGTAPSGANRQPWHFVVVTDAETRLRVREAAEREERDFYEKRAPQDWLDALAPLGTGPTSRSSRPRLCSSPSSPRAGRRARMADGERTTTCRNPSASPPASSSPRCTCVDSRC